MKDQCDEMVPDPFGVGMHRCPRKAREGSMYCTQHHNMHHPPEFTPRQHQANPSGKTSMSIISRLTWPVDEAPTVKGKYTARPIYATTLTLQTGSRSDRITLRASGPMVKKDGSAGVDSQEVAVEAHLFAPATELLIGNEMHRLEILMKEMTGE